MNYKQSIFPLSVQEDELRNQDGVELLFKLIEYNLQKIHWLQTKQINFMKLETFQG